MRTRDFYSVLLLAAGSLVLLPQGAAMAGAPAPRPDTGGVHQPEHQLANLGAVTFRNGEVVDDDQDAIGLVRAEVNRAEVKLDGADDRPPSKVEARL